MGVEISHILIPASQTFRLKPPFSSVLLNFGAGLNADAINFPFLEAKIRGGFGGSYSYFPKSISDRRFHYDYKL